MSDQRPTLDYQNPPPAKRPRHISIWFLFAGLLLIPGFFVAIRVGYVTANPFLILLALALILLVPCFVVAACVLFLTGR